MNPDVAMSSNNVYVVWCDNGAGGVLFKKSSDGGLTFGDPVSVSKTGGSFDLHLTDFDIVASGNNVYVTWQMWGAVSFAKSTDGGNTFTPKKYVADGGYPALALVGQKVYLA